jgi:hypothetical protein
MNIFNDSIPRGLFHLHSNVIVKKSAVAFWYMTSHSFIEVERRFRGCDHPDDGDSTNLRNVSLSYLRRLSYSYLSTREPET